MGDIQTLPAKNFLSAAQADIDWNLGLPDDAQVDELQPVADFDTARWAVAHYEAVDAYAREYVPRVKVLCYYPVLDDYMLCYDITLAFEEYDSATDTLLKELEVAYGIDLSEFYYENVK